MNHDRHHHHHDHHDGPRNYNRAFAVGISLNVGFVAVEVIAGLAAGSMALLADAGHNLSDVLGLVVAWAGSMMVTRPRSHRFTYGLKKGSILAALTNALFLLVAIGAIISETIRRFFTPEATNGAVVIAVALVGILVNAMTAWLFASGRKGDINIRGAYLHMAADAGVSAAVVAAGAIILWTGWMWVDPVASLVVAVVILWGSIGLLKESVWMTLAGVPEGIDVPAVQESLAELPGVAAVHDLHIWPLSTTETALTAHLVTPDGHADDLLARARSMLHEKFGIEHSTIQLERVQAADCDIC
jgi:cobalt-zinc-cadmium efflux system protein